MNTTQYPETERYLQRLDRCLRDLPRAQREEIMEEVRTHIEEELAVASSDAHVRNILDDLGDPEMIAADARTRFDVAPRKAGTLEGFAIAGLLVGGLILPFVGWFVGVVLLWISRVWTTRDKLIGTFVLPGGLAFAFFVFFMMPVGISDCQTSPGRGNGSLETVTMCSKQPLTSEVWGALVVIGIVLLPIATAIYLGRRAWNRDAT